MIAKREREKGLDRPTNGGFLLTISLIPHKDIARLMGQRFAMFISKRHFDLTTKHPFKGNFDLEKLEKAFKRREAHNVPYIVCTITCNSAWVSRFLCKLKGMYEIARKYDIPVIMDSARFAENAYFVQQREEAYKTGLLNKLLESYRYADGLAMSAKKMLWCQWEVF